LVSVEGLKSPPSLSFPHLTVVGNQPKALLGAKCYLAELRRHPLRCAALSRHQSLVHRLGCHGLEKGNIDPTIIVVMSMARSFVLLLPQKSRHAKIGDYKES